ncbi:FMN binding [Chlorella sorokiniana]|uniref:FMN binding n=1 Tax=Chlorella sorokiniana TaxID=3076 RepID=A0A2P6TTN2_CHLSO|nr:FMN binding [Chlorella sorokiniana]|eukprot:PRW57427.1 FMN binding [Chlorella sorokiniana]
MQCALTRALPAVSGRQSAHAQPSSQVVRALGSRRAARLAPAAAAAAASNGAAAACNGSASLSGNGSSAAAGGTPTAAETARTIVDLVAHGTLCTLGEDGVPLGTYASYVLDAAGQPILRLRADAVHTANLKRNSKCSLFVQPGERPASLLARVTLIGEVEPISEEMAAKAADLHSTLHAGGMGVDAPQPTDLYFRLRVDRCFYVGQLSGGARAEVLDGDAYRGAETDPLRTCAAALTRQMNEDRPEDMLRISCHAMGESFDDMAWAEMLWVDRLGVYMRAAKQDGSEARDLRVPFVRPVEDEREARSALTMMAQVAWEAQRPYTPAAPSPPSQDAANN